VGGRDGTVHLYRVATRQSAVLSGQRGTIESIAFSRNGAFVATVSRDGTARIWRARPDLVVTLRRSGNGVVAVVTNAGPFPTRSVQVVTRFGGGGISAHVAPPFASGTQRRFVVPAPPRGTTVTVSASSGADDADAADNVAVLGAVGPAPLAVPAPPRAASTAAEIVQAARVAVRNGEQIHYSTGSDRMVGVIDKIRLPRVPRAADSSSFVTWCYWQAGAPDPNGAGYDGFGYLGTLATHGVRVPKPRPGDVVLYGAGAVPSIAGIYIGDDRVVVNGSESGPDIRKLDFARTPHQFRRYEEAARASATG
jgi:cell wall-associated NlpC family hydrolase